ncbi:MAG: chitobiase/beta-hexosaminidase C-terminal domain-containing protein [Verrucomicrobia bacterium]|nr:chitobiase/beta-hexosaminidase C-terminal domain-containing protein [Verrucomicrobiota bacterium]
MDSLNVPGLSEPYGVAVDVSTNLYYLTDSAHDRIVRLDPRTGEQVPLGAQELFSPQGLVLARGGLVVAEAGSHLISLVTLDGTVATLAGSERGFADGAAVAAKFSAPAGLAVDAAGTILIADAKNNAIRKLAPDGTVSTLPIPGDQTLFEPAGVAVGEGGRIFIADTRNHVLKLIEGDGTVKTIAGKLGISGAEDGTGTGAAFNNPRGLLWVGGETGLLVGDAGNNAVRRVRFSAARGAWTVDTYAGKAGEAGLVNGALAVSRFNSPLGMAIDAEGNILIADLYNNELRVVKRVAPPVPAIAPGGGSYSNSVTVAISSTVPGLTFRYTTDGKAVTPLSTSTPGALTFTGGPVPLQVRAFSPDFATTATVSNNYAFFVNPLRLSVPGGTFSNNVALVVSTLTDSAKIRFTTDGTEPTAASTEWADGSFGLTGPLVLRAFRDGFDPSAVSSNSFTFLVAPIVIAPNGATANNDVEVKLGTETEGADVYVTTNGEEPTPLNGFKYSGAFLLGTNGTLKAKGFKGGYVASQTASAVFNLSVATPLIIPGGATNHNTVKVELVTATDGAKIYWTIDGKDPKPGDANTTLYAGPFDLAQNGTLKVQALKNGYVESEIVSADFHLDTANPLISPNGATSINPVTVTLGSATDGAKIYWTIDGSDPTSASTLYAGPFVLAQNGTLKARAFRDGFVVSEIVSADFNLSVGDPTISPNGATSNNEVTVTLATGTTDTKLYWTIDGSAPTEASTLYAGPFVLAQDGTLQVKGFRAGFLPSDIVSAPFNLSVATPAVTPASGKYINSVSVTVTTTTATAELRYTLDGSDPTAASTLYAGAFTIDTIAELRVAGFRNGFVASGIVGRSYQIQVDTPTMSPADGFFPNGTTVSFAVKRADAKIYYTLDGSDPTEESLLYTGPVTVNQLVTPGGDLRQVRARAFAPNTLPSEVVSGQPVQANGIGVPRDAVGGIGSAIVVPVVLNLEPEQVLRSLQFRVQVTPSSAGAPNLLQSLRVLGISSNDFVQVVSPAQAGAAATFNFSTYTDDGPGGIKTHGVIISAIGTNANFKVTDFATVSLLGVSLPPTAKENDTYKIEVVQPSGTSDGQQQVVELAPLTSRTITVKNIAYIVGDSAAGAWYNAGDFGDGELDNSDVNNAFYASLGVRVPYNFTDVFDAMDAFPEDIAGAVGGDGQIRFLDWQRILRRSSRRDANNWQRIWGAGGVRTATRASLPSALSPVVSIDGALRGEVWAPQAELSGVSQENAQPGARVRVPVRVRLAGNANLAGLQFRAIVKPQAGAPALERAVDFEPALPNPTPVNRAVLPPNEVAAAWSILPSAFETPLAGEAHVGVVSFDVPASAAAGSVYTVSFANADGAPDLSTQYDFETSAANVWVQAPAKPTPTPATPLKGFKLNWYAESGKRYVIEASSDLSAGWTTLATGVLGQGKVQQFLDTTAAAGAKFYRVREQR